MGDSTGIVSLDLRGLKCPLPVLKSRRRFVDLAPGTLVDIATTDPLAGIDIPHFCQEDGHHVLDMVRDETGHRFRIRVGG